MYGKNAHIRLVSEFYGTFGTKFFIEMETAANTSVIEISETTFNRLRQEQDFGSMPLSRDKPLPHKVEICNQRKEWI